MPNNVSTRFLIDNSTLTYLMPFRRRQYYLYMAVLLLVIGGIACLPFVRVTVSVNTQGIVRPASERTAVKNMVSGVIENIFYKEGDTVAQGAVLLRIKDKVSEGKRLVNNFALSQRAGFIGDLTLLTSAALNEDLLSQLASPLYKEQLSQYLNTLADREANLRKATKELNMNQQLFNDKVISAKEFFDTQVAYDKAVAAEKSLERTQKSAWQQDLIKYNLESSEYKQQLGQVNSDASYYDVKAPISGTVQDINTLYAGGNLQAGENICTLSPNDNLIGECYVSTKDIGLIKAEQSAIFQIDAFDYNYFGTVGGKVSNITGDYTVQQQGQQPVFIVRCKFNDTKLKLKNGYQTGLKKGLTFQARFIIGERTLWQLLWDKIDNWLNPNSNIN
jgi:HlyD family secretion protein